MAGEKDSKTEPPTPRRRREARRSGQVPKSQDLSAAFLLLGGLVSLRYLGPAIWGRLLSMYRVALSGSDNLDGRRMLPMVMEAGEALTEMLAPFLLVMVLLTLLVLYFQVGFLWTFKPLTPSLNKLNPITGLGRIFSTRSLVMLVLNVGKLALVVTVAVVTVRSVADQILFSLMLDYVSVFGLVAALVFQLGVTLAIVLLVLALFDYAYQRYKHEQDLKMSKDEVKDEMRSMEGDPVVKRRRREVQLQLAFQRLKKDVPEADVVVSNPTHVAVAIKYDAENMASPRVVAKGADLMALRIRQLAAAAGVPIMERPPLARALYESVKVGQEVPERFFQAVAEVLAYVYELAGRDLGPQPVAVS